MQDFNRDQSLSYRKMRNSLSFARHVQAVVVSKRNCFTLASIESLRAIVVAAVCLASCVENMKGPSSDLKAFLQLAGRISSILLIEAVQYHAREAIGKRRRGNIVVKSSHLNTWESGNSAGLVQVWVLLSKESLRLLTSLSVLN